MSFDFPGLGRATGNVADRFLLFIEQLEQALLLLESDRIARQRMALVALDNLAEGLIFHHLQKVFLAGDEPTWVEHREFSASERRRAGRSFNKRVELATEKLESAPPVYFPDRILDAHDAIVFRVAHHYRNPIYHQDRHNPTLILPVGRLYAQAVGRAFVRSHRGGWAVSSSSAFMQELSQLGWRGRGDTYFEPRAAAEAIIARTCDPLAVDVAALRTELADDIAYRCEIIDEDFHLLRRDSFIELEDFLVTVQDWAAHRGDEEMLRLSTKHRELKGRAKAIGTFDEATLKAMRDLEHQQWVHLFGPNREVKTKVDLQSHISIGSRGERLRSSRATEAHLLEQYQRLDDELQLLEAAIDFMMFETDRQTWAEQDRTRGR
ncbi:MAG: hypothetical protein WD942_06840 [Dehalococcoidia bacterium]